jgi:hypothetical protein
MKLEFSQIDIRRMLKYKISSKFFQWEPSWSVRTDGRREGQTDRHDEANSYFPQFYGSAHKGTQKENYFSNFTKLCVELCDLLNNENLLVYSLRTQQCCTLRDTQRIALFGRVVPNSLLQDETFPSHANFGSYLQYNTSVPLLLQGGSNMTGTDCV